MSEENLTIVQAAEETDMKKMPTDRPQRRGGRGRPGRRGNKVDVKVKLERSRQSARECRARKKLRYQYLEDLVSNREQAIFKLREELELYKQYCIDLDQGKIPEKLLKDLANAKSKGENSDPQFVPMTTANDSAIATTSGEELQETNEDVYRHPISDIGCFSGVPTTRNPSIDLFSSFEHSSGDCHVTYSNYANSLSSNLHYPSEIHVQGRTLLDRQLASDNRLSSLVSSDCEAQRLAAENKDSFTNSTALERFQVAGGNLVPPTTSQSMSKLGGNMSFMSLLQDSGATQDGESDVFVDVGFSIPIVTSADGSPSVALVPHTPVLPTILEEMNIDTL